MPKFVVNHEYVPVSVYFIENFLKDASGIFLKVYLYALNLAQNGIEIDNGTIAEELNILESDVLQAFTYWQNVGMLVEDSGVVEFCAEPVIDEPEPKIIPSKESTSGEKKVYDSVEVAKKISENQDLSEMALLAQELLGKPLTTSEMETLYWFYDGMDFSTEAILLILDYCVAKDKRNMRYIEKVAVAWSEKGIKTPEQIMDYTSNEEKKNSFEYKLQRAMGIADRALSKAEEQYISTWHDQYGYDEEMILLAYEYCLLNTTKLSFPYMDKIIERWNKQGIRTKQEAEEDNNRFKKGSANAEKAKLNVYDDIFNHNKLERITRDEEED